MGTSFHTQSATDALVSDNDTTQYFDTVADQWDDMRRTFFGEGVRDAAIGAARIAAGSVVADVGTVALSKLQSRLVHPLPKMISADRPVILGAGQMLPPSIEY